MMLMILLLTMDLQLLMQVAKLTYLKHGSNLKVPSTSLDRIRSLGFNMLTVANNHIFDYGKDGLEANVNKCNKICT